MEVEVFPFSFTILVICEHAAKTPCTCECSVVPSQRGDPAARRSEGCWISACLGLVLQPTIVSGLHDACQASDIAWLLGRWIRSLNPIWSEVQIQCFPIKCPSGPNCCESGAPCCHLMRCTSLKLQIIQDLVCSWAWYFMSTIPAL